MGQGQRVQRSAGGSPQPELFHGEAVQSRLCALGPRRGRSVLHAVRFVLHVAPPPPPLSVLRPSGLCHLLTVPTGSPGEALGGPAHPGAGVSGVPPVAPPLAAVRICNGACGQAKRYCLLDALASHILLEHPSCPVQPLPPSQEFADSEPASRTVGHIESWRSSPSPPSNISGLGLRRRGTCSRILDGDPQTLELPILQAFLQWTIARHRARKALVHGSAAAEEMASEGL